MADLTTDAAADRLRVVPFTIRRWIDRGAFPGARRIGRRWFIPEEEVERVRREGLDLSKLDRQAA